MDNFVDYHIIMGYTISCKLSCQLISNDMNIIISAKIDYESYLLCLLTTL
ncbi:hypothetical protein FYL05_08565 [Lactobacillus salivarius]|uniref:Uncharacterized protein n=1 Tax=Ligilactobacillus salivarius (strain UCC118) TaxID=362948 RepID=A0JQI3_LIGS1|nr:Hypothetical protein, phage associated [Ligilactobacillus salivarius UCC118]MYU73643.1 hypothetical protein [Ligilactobacillus salivarius]DAE67880.1 MAG TPA: hypothetical protein [Caudoviricetes sp.]MYU96033.1 hypothetical protein [Ligilactobacillus salivarius]MYV19907.1 hypothetical protein [Ligilactobacillus salivarius]